MTLILLFAVLADAALNFTRYRGLQEAIEAARESLYRLEKELHVHMSQTHGCACSDVRHREFLKTHSAK